MLKDMTLPGAPGFTSKPQAPPLPNTPQPTIKTAQNINPQTGLTPTESALLSPSEQVIARRT